jgi:ferredoxin
MKVWIDQISAPATGSARDRTRRVHPPGRRPGLRQEGDKVYSDPGGAEGLAVVPAGQEEATIESAEECPGECIFIEID